VKEVAAERCCLAIFDVDGETKACTVVAKERKNRRGFMIVAMLLFCGDQHLNVWCWDDVSEAVAKARCIKDDTRLKKSAFNPVVSFKEQIRVP
jgi:hypothetical protein